MNEMADDFPAFPCGADVTQGQWAPHPGMTMRDYFASKAMQQAYTHFSGESDHTKHWTTEGIAESAYAMADAMLNARSKA